MYQFVVAVGKNNEMGVDNKLPWHLPNDVKFFKEVTWDHPMIMGRKTFESLPKVLPNRQHIVLTRDKNYTVNHKRVTVVYSFEELLEMTQGSETYSIIGGAEIFNLFMPYADRILLTKIDAEFKADTYFEEPNPEEWEIIEVIEGKVDKENTLAHQFIIMDRIKK